ncbi:uncharacterized protein LOC130565890 [Triplophysa rosa]|uniref:uncharacterized protein LOC130565890 n=1 Tax=Triplophysa rosa TaxID=992332 RepID=UPI00254622C9|nr:uncharacterized protein LOC130565890 [Triplophysa rosa]
MDTSQEECPVCKDKIRNPSQPSPCCKKIICQSCLGQSLRFRAHCPHCRTPVTNPLHPATHRRGVRLPILIGNDEIFNVQRTVGSNIQNRLLQLQAAQAALTNAANQASLPNLVPAPALQRQAPPLSNATVAIIPPVPARRARPQPALIITTIQPATVNAVPAPPASPAPLYHNPAQENLEDDLDDWHFQTEINEMGMRQQEQIQGSTLRTLVCPYCQMGGLDAMELRVHCNAQHAYDSTHVVCPVCVVLPHGDPQYYSRNFIGHLNMRHCYYIEDITNIHQNDEVNFQCALMASFIENIPM